MSKSAYRNIAPTATPGKPRHPETAREPLNAASANRIDAQSATSGKPSHPACRVNAQTATRANCGIPPAAPASGYRKSLPNVMSPDGAKPSTERFFSWNRIARDRIPSRV